MNEETEAGRLFFLDYNHEWRYCLFERSESISGDSVI